MNSVVKIAHVPEKETPFLHSSRDPGACALFQDPERARGRRFRFPWAAFSGMLPSVLPAPMKLILSLVLLFAAVIFADAANVTRSVQEELRRRNDYFGEINGQDSPELASALKRYQSRKGFSTTGEPDRDTLRSLGLLPRQAGESPPKELEWPEEPVLRSDSVIDVAQTAEAIAEETGVDAASIAPEAVEDSRKAGRTRRTASAKPEPRRDEPAERRSRGDDSANFAAQEVEPREMMKFVRDYLAAVSRNDVSRELPFYGDKVDYYRAGSIDRRIVERGLREYYKKWPKRKQSLVDVISYRKDRERGEIHLVFRTRIALRNDRHRIKGETRNHLVINAATEDPRIISISEERVRG